MRFTAVLRMPQLDLPATGSWGCPRRTARNPGVIMKLDAAIAIAESLPSVTVGTKWRARTWMVSDRGFLWERPLGKTDIERLGDNPIPTGDIVGIIVENLNDKDALLAMELPGFFTIQHFNGYPGLLIELRLAQAEHVRAAITEAHRVAVLKGPPKSRRKPAKKSASKPVKKPANKPAKKPAKTPKKKP